MANELTERDIKVLAGCAFTIVIVIMLGILIFAGQQGYCQPAAEVTRLVESYIGGHGFVDNELNDKQMTVRVRADDATYRQDSSLSVNSNGDKKISSKVELHNATGTRGTLYQFTLNGAEHSAYGHYGNISDDFEATQDAYIDLDDSTGIINVDEVAEVHGVGVGQFRIVDASSGKPLSVSRYKAIGALDFWNHLNITMIPVTPEDFCSVVEQGLPGLKVVPLASYTPDG